MSIPNKVTSTKKKHPHVGLLYNGHEAEAWCEDPRQEWKTHKNKVIRNEEVAEEASWGLAELQGLTVRMNIKYIDVLTK